jgi:hypothetical protein
VSPDNRKLAIALALVLAIVFAFVGSNVATNHAPKPHDMPVGLVGSPQTVAALAGQLDLNSPGSFRIRTYASDADARTAVLDRKVYGAFEPGPRPSLLVASAASPPAELVLQETFQPIARAQGQALRVDDLAPLPSSDSSGATAFSVLLSLVIAGVLGSSVIYMVSGHRPLAVRLGAVLVLGVGAGLVTALVTNVIVGAFSGHFLGVWGIATLFVLAVALPIAAFQTLLGLPGTGIGLLVFVVLGTPSSGGGTAPELLPSFWRAISQLLPPGAADTVLHDVVYFHGNGATAGLIVLAAYAILGVAGALAIHAISVRRAGRMAVAA